MAIWYHLFFKCFVVVSLFSRGRKLHALCNFNMSNVVALKGLKKSIIEDRILAVYHWMLNQWLFLVPIKGGLGGIVHPPIGRKYTTYSPCLVGGYIIPTTFYQNLKNPLTEGQKPNLSSDQFTLVGWVSLGG